MHYLEPNTLHAGKSQDLMPLIKPESIALSFWSPPYFVGKDYEKDETFDSWQDMLKKVIGLHTAILKPGGFMVINIADILCFSDEQIPRFQAQNLKMHRVAITSEMVLAAKRQHPDYNRNQLAELLGCSEQTIDRRVNGNNIRGGKYQAQTRVKLIGHYLEQYAYDNGLFLYDKRVWVKDPTWQNSRWTTTSLKAVSEYEDLYVFWKPGQQVIDRGKLNDNEWGEWGSRAVWNISSVRSNLEHEAQFPLELASRVVRLYTDKGDTVLDPFIGSGTTAIAAAKFGRNYIGIDKESKYIELSRQNIRNKTSQLPLIEPDISDAPRIDLTKQVEVYTGSHL